MGLNPVRLRVGKCGPIATLFVLIGVGGPASCAPMLIEGDDLAAAGASVGGQSDEPAPSVGGTGHGGATHHGGMGARAGGTAAGGHAPIGPGSAGSLALGSGGGLPGTSVGGAPGSGASSGHPPMGSAGDGSEAGGQGVSVGAPGAGGAGDGGGETGEGGVAGGSGSLGPLVAPELHCWSDVSEGGAGGAPDRHYFAADVIAGAGRAVGLTAMNTHGQIVANVEPEGVPGDCRPFLLDESGFHALEGVPEELLCVYAADIADNGEILLGDHQLPVSEPLLWVEGTVSELAGAGNRYPIEINTHRQVLLMDGYGEGFVWEAGVVTPILSQEGAPLMPVAMNNLGQVIAERGDLEATFLWDAGIATELPFFNVIAINDQGQIAGYFRDMASGPGVLNDINVGIYQNGVLTPFDTGRVWPTGDRDREIHVFGLSERGDVAGEMPPMTGLQPIPFVRYASGDTVLLPVIEAGEAREVSDAGVIFGYQYGVEEPGPSAPFVRWRPTIWSPRCIGSCCR
jgi:hypothetical protein